MTIFINIYEKINTFSISKTIIFALLFPQRVG